LLRKINIFIFAFIYQRNVLQRYLHTVLLERISSSTWPTGTGENWEFISR